uniref:VWFA domain-containing protein n=1 Tax=Esox lucius TaxID=8010 RepID=A0A6Q2YY61_ESOLU
VSQGVLTFNIDPVAWKHISTPADGFGYKVVQWNPNSTMNPLLYFTVPSQGINMSLGLSMTKDPMSSKAMVCGPTIPRECKTITTYNGMCFQIEQSLSVGSAVPSSLEECPGQTDIAFLLDGSGSVNPTDFVRMKTFVKDLISPFLERDTRFALAQYSGYCQIHFKFTDNVDISQVDKISQQGGGTYTAAAITKVVQEIFNSEEHRKRILIVITDGQSHDSPKLKNAASEAEKKNIIRFAIGVGRAFRTSSAMEELNTIASSPSNKHVFQVGSFEALNQIKDTLQSSIFPIEGMVTYLDLSEGYLLGSVGAFQWRGAYLEYKRSTIKATPQQSQKMEPDSYMGYSMAVARTRFRQLTILGAPRFNHTGRVVVFYSNEKPIEANEKPIEFSGQIGAYFGAEICVVDLENDFYTDLVLISAPMFKDKDREGLVFVCTINTLLVCTFNAEMTLKGAAGIIGRFGTSLAPLPDLNVDGFNDLAVGAPLENNGQGSVYIFHGSSNGIRKIYSQRISGSDVQSGLMFFGLSISPSSLDMSLDSLPDLAVGSKGAVIILRSRPIVTVTTEVFFSPSKISTKSSSCNTPHKNTAKVCFTMTKKTAEATKGQARVNYTLTLDVTRQAPNYRAYYNSQDKIRKKTETVTLTNERMCFDQPFLIMVCLAISVCHLKDTSTSLHFFFNDKCVIFPKLGFEINCGTDNNCVDNLKVDFNFTGSLEMKVGIDDVLNVTVSVESLEENSYNSRVIVTYPAGLSFRKFTTIQGRVECNSMDSEHGVTPGQSDCVINKPIFRSNSKVCSTHNLIITTCSHLQNCCGNNAHSLSSELFREKKIGVKYSIYVLITRHEDSTQYIKFTAGKNDLQKHVKQSFVVNIIDFNLTVIIKVPMKLGDKSIWADQNSIQIPGCHRDKNEGPISTDFVYKLKKDSILDCSVATCGVFMCNVFIRKDAHNSFNISGNLSSGWIEQIGLESAQFSLVSTATLAYDRNQYIYFSSDSKNNPHFQTVEVYTEVNFTKEIIGGAVGGLFLLALITAGLYKAGFFKSHYKQMMNDASGDMPGNDGEAALAE